MTALTVDRPSSAAFGPWSNAGVWLPGPTPPTREPARLRAALHDPGQPLVFVQTAEGPALALAGEVRLGAAADSGLPLAALVPALPPETLGDSSFRDDLGLRYAYAAGSMANGIASVALVRSMRQAGMLGFFGAAGLSLARIEDALRELARDPDPTPYGINLIHSPHEPDHEDATVDLFLRHGVRLIEASAFLDLTLPLVRYRLAGLQRGPAGTILARHRVIGKVSRIEVATRFFSPAPDKLIGELLRRGQITPEQAEMARHVPIAQDLTAEADSGGHTDNRPLVALLPTLAALRDRLQERFGYPQPLRLGAAGGLATPEGVAAAFALGAAYVMTGSINQACVESGSSDRVRALLAQAEQADVIMAPAADMFEMGVKVQVLKRGTLFAMRAARLYDCYRAHASLDAIPEAERARLEKDLFRAPLDAIWQETRQFWSARDPAQVARAERDPKHRMALVFRWYLGLSSRWANAGEDARQADFQIWCGPAMGAFNEWVRGSFLEQPANRRADRVARELLWGAAIAIRTHMAACQGVRLPDAITRVTPREPGTA